MVVYTCNRVFGKLRQEDYFDVKASLENIAKSSSKKKKKKGGGMCQVWPQQRQADLCKFEASMVYMASSRTARAM
jgi:hypothetical protein